ncbi:MAG: phage portal protein [Bacteroidota bacterium]
MGLFKNPFSKKNRVQIIDNDVDKFLQAFLQWIGGNYTQYDTNLRSYIEKGLLYNPDVYSIVHQQATKTASVPWRVIQGEEETVMDFPLERPNTMQTWAQVKYLQKQFLKTTGNIFLYTPSSNAGLNKGVPKALYVLPSHMMKIVIKQDIDLKNYDESPISHYMLIEGRVYTEFEAENVIHISYPNPDYDLNGSHLYGLSPLRPILRNIQSSNLAIDGNIKAMLNSGVFGFLHGKGDNVLTDTQAKAIKTRLKEMEKGENRLSRMAAVDREIGFTRVAMTTDELKPFDFLKFDQKQLCNALGWSDKLLNNDEGGKYDNVSQFRKQVITDNIMPDNQLINEAYTKYFIQRFPGYENSTLISIYDELPEMQENMTELSKWLSEMKDRGIINADEAREKLGLERIGTPEMEVFAVRDDIIPVSEALNQEIGIDDQAGVQA